MHTTTTWDYLLEGMVWQWHFCGWFQPTSMALCSSFDFFLTWDFLLMFCRTCIVFVARFWTFSSCHLVGLFWTCWFPFSLECHIVWVILAFDFFCCSFFVLILAFLWLFGAVAFIGLPLSFDLLTFSFVNVGHVFWLFPLWVSFPRELLKKSRFPPTTTQFTNSLREKHG